MSFSTYQKPAAVDMSYQFSRVSTVDEDALTERARSNIEQLQQNIAHLTRLVNYLGTNRDSSNHRQKLLTEMNECRELLKETKKVVSELHDQPPERKEERQFRQKLARDFRRACENFADISDLAKRKQRQFAQVTSPRDEHTVDVGFDDHQLDERQALLYSSYQIVDDRLDKRAAAMADKEASIQAIEQDMAKLLNLFQDMAVLVDEQGAYVDNIEANIANTAASARQGEQALIQAAKYQRDKRFRWCCLMVAVVIAILVLILVYS